jgi:hypothetical protein
MPSDHCQLAGARHRRDLLPPAVFDTQEEGAQRSRRLRYCPCSLDKHSTRVRTTAFADAPVLRRLKARLIDRWIQPEVADEFFRGRKTADLADRGDQAEGDQGIDAGDRHQPCDLRLGQRRSCQHFLDLLRVVRQQIQGAQALLYADALVKRKWLIC